MIALGNKRLLDNKLAAILNSSQSKTPCGNDLWVRGSIEAAKSLMERGYTVVSSLYLVTWELIVFLVSEHNGCQIIVSPAGDEDTAKSIFDRTAAQFRLNREKTAMVFIKPEAEKGKPKTAWFRRDKAVVQLADLLAPVSIRAGGKLEKLLSETRKDISHEFKINYARSLIKPPRYDFSKIVFPEGKWDYIAHWTRTHHGAWAGESKYDYYKRLVVSGSEYPNSAFNTLKNIIQKKKIFGSSEKIRNSIKCIGFSDLDPKSMLRWMRWLPKRVNWNFEPYGIAIRKNAAGKLGIRQVIYGDDKAYENMPEKDRPYFQSRGSRGADWSEENEWRKTGDLTLEGIAGDDLALIVWSKNEAIELSKISDLQIFSFQDG